MIDIADAANELILYAAINETIAIFHLGGAPLVFKPGRLNHVSRPVILSRVEYLLTSSINLVGFLRIFPCIQRGLVGEPINNVPH